jgi:hypothetical protein
MATENTLAIRRIGRVNTTRFVNTPGRGIGVTKPVLSTRDFLQHKIGRVVHDGATPRVGSFNPPPRSPNLKNIRKESVRNHKANL